MFGRYFRQSSAALDCVYSLWYKAPTMLPCCINSACACQGEGSSIYFRELSYKSVAVLITLLNLVSRVAVSVQLLLSDRAVILKSPCLSVSWIVVFKGSLLLVSFSCINITELSVDVFKTKSIRGAIINCKY